MLDFIAPLAGAAARCLLAAATVLDCLPAAAVDAANAPERPEGPRPNIVMIMTDDLDDEVFDSALEGGWLPHIQEQMVDKGTTFANAFVSTSICCPSRTTYLTGQYAHNHGIYGNVGPHGGFDSFDDDGSTLATWLHAAGYRTGIIGKYLNGYGTSAKSRNGRYVAPGWDTWDALFSVSQYDYDMSMNGQRTHFGHAESDYQTDVLAGLAHDFIVQARFRQPFFLTVTPTAPHYEEHGDDEADTHSDDEGDDSAGKFIRPPKRYLDTPPLKRLPLENWPSFNESDMSDKPRWMQKLPLVDPVEQRAGYNSKIAAMRAVDDLVDTVMSTLAQTGELANTLVLLTSDNGFQYGTHRLTQKTLHYEEAIRVPMFVRAPGQVRARASSAWAMNIDWAPTILDYAGAKPDITMDGESLRPWVDGDPGRSAGRRTLLVELPDSGGPRHRHKPFAMIRTSDATLTGDASGRKVMVYAETYDFDGRLNAREMYDLADDPYEDDNPLSRADAQRVGSVSGLAARLAQLRACAGDTCRALQR